MQGVVAKNMATPRVLEIAGLSVLAGTAPSKWGLYTGRDAIFRTDSRAQNLPRGLWDVSVEAESW